MYKKNEKSKIHFSASFLLLLPKNDVLPKNEASISSFLKLINNSQSLYLILISIEFYDFISPFSA